MKRVKRFAVITMLLCLAIIFTGCGCQNNSDENNSNSTTQEVNNSNKSTSDSVNTNANTDFEPTISLEQRKAVRVEDYIDGSTTVDANGYTNLKPFDLNGYAKALGYTKLDDPKGAVFYAIKRDGVKCYFTIADHMLVAFFDYGDGYTYQTDPLSLGSESDGYVIDTGSKEGQQVASRRYMEGITTILSSLSTENIELNHLPEFRAVFKIKGSPKYYPNGVIQEVEKDIVETITRNSASY